MSRGDNKTKRRLLYVSSNGIEGVDLRDMSRGEREALGDKWWWRDPHMDIREEVTEWEQCTLCGRKIKHTHISCTRGSGDNESWWAEDSKHHGGVCTYLDDVGLDGGFDKGKVVCDSCVKKHRDWKRLAYEQELEYEIKKLKTDIGILGGRKTKKILSIKEKLSGNVLAGVDNIEEFLERY